MVLAVERITSVDMHQSNAAPDVNLTVSDVKLETLDMLGVMEQFC
jgi:hypothetical protein